jgi:hypothetical protein
MQLGKAIPCGSPRCRCQNSPSFLSVVVKTLMFEAGRRLCERAVPDATVALIPFGQDMAKFVSNAITSTGADKPDKDPEPTGESGGYR